MQFGPLGGQNLLLSSLIRSQAAEATRRSAPPAASATSAEPQLNTLGSAPTHEQQQDLQESMAAADSVAFPATSSSVLRMQESGLIPAPVPRYMALDEGSKCELFLCVSITFRLVDNEMRALEMSMNALAVAGLLQRTRGGLLADPFGENDPSTSSQAVPSTSDTPFRRYDAVNQAQTTINAPSTAFHGLPAASNIWGVPADSVMQDSADYREVAADEDDHSRPPNAFNV